MPSHRNQCWESRLFTGTTANGIICRPEALSCRIIPLSSDYGLPTCPMVKIQRLCRSGCRGSGAGDVRWWGLVITVDGGSGGKKLQVLRSRRALILFLLPDRNYFSREGCNVWRLAMIIYVYQNVLEKRHVWSVKVCMPWFNNRSTSTLLHRYKKRIQLEL